VKAFDLKVVTPEGVKVEEKVESLVLPGREGSLGAWGGHEPWLILLKPGAVSYLPHGGREWKSIEVGGGMAELGHDSAVVLADPPRGRGGRS
jgi:F-type H+-transporting ATPase subunit epsilon